MTRKAYENFVVIDDDTVSNMISKSFIRLCFPGASIEVFADPDDALAFIRASSEKSSSYRKLVFLDICMSPMTGWDVLEALRRLPEDIRHSLDIYMLTSSLNPMQRARATDDALVAGIIEKPLSVGLLKELAGTGG